MKLIVANWKCNPSTLSEAKSLFDEVKKRVEEIYSKKKLNSEVVICPPFIYLSELQSSTYHLYLGAQDCFWEEKGAFTGEISPLMLRKLGCHYVILGHSERRRYLKETNQMIAKKIVAALKFRLKPILCIGETLEERKQEKTAYILKTQLRKSLELVISYKLSVSNLVIAYEPVWAIGTGNNCSVDDAMTSLMFIKRQLLNLFPKKNPNKIKILYGGSVNSKNAKDYIDVGFDGLLIGGASLKAREFIKIIHFIQP